MTDYFISHEFTLNGARIQVVVKPCSHTAISYIIRDGQRKWRIASRTYAGSMADTEDFVIAGAVKHALYGAPDGHETICKFTGTPFDHLVGKGFDNRTVARVY